MWNAGEADNALFAVFQKNVNFSALANGLFVLADLVALRKVRIKIMFSGKAAGRYDFSAHGEADTDGELDHLTVQDGENARRAQGQQWWCDRLARRRRQRLSRRKFYSRFLAERESPARLTVS